MFDIRRERVALLAGASTIVASVVVIADSQPAAADGCLTRTWGRLCEETVWLGSGSGRYLSHGRAVRWPSTPVEVASQCDMQARGRNITYNQGTIYYEGPIRHGCVAPWDAPGVQRHWHGTYYRTGSVKSYEWYGNIDSICVEYTENVFSHGTAFYHVHRWAC